MTDHEVLTGDNDLEMMRRPHLWPPHPWLPLKMRQAGLAMPRLALLQLESDDLDREQLPLRPP